MPRQARESGPRTTTYSWFTDGRLQSVSRPNGTTRTISYDAEGRPNGITESAGLNWTIGYWASDDIRTLDGVITHIDGRRVFSGADVGFHIAAIRDIEPYSVPCSH
jgi:YD repeat-containing protein